MAKKSSGLLRALNSPIGRVCHFVDTDGRTHEGVLMRARKVRCMERGMTITPTPGGGREYDFGEVVYTLPRHIKIVMGRAPEGALAWRNANKPTGRPSDPAPSPRRIQPEVTVPDVWTSLAKRLSAAREQGPNAETRAVTEVLLEILGNLSAADESFARHDGMLNVLERRVRDLEGRQAAL